MSVLELLDSFEDEVLDPEEETFALFSAPIPSANLGFIDPRAAELDITLPPNRDFTIHQSPTLLASSRAGGTTGAVLWKITPLFAAFLSFDLVVACDCIYNDALVEPLVQTSVDACLLRRRDEGATAREPTLCIVAQQLRSPEVFEAWLKAFHRRFRVWRVPDQVVGEGLAVGSGFVVHVGILRD
ncbi:Phosphoenolpyruvate carboxykinase [ATP] [Verticillium dahliae VDG1]|nr:Phosphoenolpyruvate carboxykinase [ATP] [Verticillium dahliae VDG1]